MRDRHQHGLLSVAKSPIDFTVDACQSQLQRGQDRCPAVLPIYSCWRY